MALSPSELDELRRARRLLESTSLAVRLTDVLGKPIEKGIELLPESATQTLHKIVRTALERALDTALVTLGHERATASSDRLHKLATATTGAMGGLFGWAGLAVELPATTVIMLRSIGDIARSEGHDLRDADVRLACVEVFALGGPGSADDAAETGYYAVRSALAKLIADAVEHIAAGRAIAARGAPALVRLIEAVAARFGIVVQEKAALEALPLVGAVGGALVNTVFMGHFQSIARGHFVVRRLERVHGIDTVRRAWNEIGRQTETERA